MDEYPIYPKYRLCALCQDTILGRAADGDAGEGHYAVGLGFICSDCEDEFKRTKIKEPKRQPKEFPKQARENLGDSFLGWVRQAIRYYDRDHWRHCPDKGFCREEAAGEFPDFRWTYSQQRNLIEESGISFRLMQPVVRQLVEFKEDFWNRTREPVYLDLRNWEDLREAYCRFLADCRRILSAAEPRHRKAFKAIVEKFESRNDE